MKLSIIKPLTWILFTCLAMINIAIFISSMQLGDKISYYEIETKRLRLENQDLEQKVYEVNSLQKAASAAAGLKFNYRAQPNYLKNMGFALK